MINKRSLIIYTLANLIFFISQIIFLCNRISFAQTNWFVYLFIADMALFILWGIMITKSCTQRMKLIDGIGMITILFSMFCITSLAYNWDLTKNHGEKPGMKSRGGLHKTSPAF